MPAWKKMVLHGSSGSLAHLKLENLTSQSVLGTDASGNVVAGSVSGYSLPTATASVLGGVKVGGTLTISSGILNAKTYVGASAAGVGEITEGGAGGSGVAGYVPAASSAQYLSFLRGDGTWQTPTNTVTRLRQSAGTLVAGDFTFAGSGATTVTYSGGTFTISSTDTDTNTTYSAGTGLTLTGTTFSVTTNTFAAAGHSHAIRDITGLQTALDGKQASGEYAASSHTHDDRYLRLTETSSFFDRVIDSAPGTLDTLNELAAAIGDDANFSASLARVIANKADSGHAHSNATTSAAGFMSTTDKSKLDGVADNANNFSLPTATASVLGGVKVGTNLSISSGVLSATDTNTVTRVGTSGDDLRAGDIQFRGSGATSITFADGTVTISSTDTDTDTNTTYSAGTGLTLTGTTFSVSANTFAAASHNHDDRYYTETEADARFILNDFGAQTAATAEDEKSGTWAESAGDSSWGSYKPGDDPTAGYSYNDAPGYVQYNIPTGYATAYIGQLRWSSGGYFDVHAVMSDGSLVFRGRYLSKNSIENESHSGNLDGQQIIKISGLDGMRSLRITNLSGRLHLQGIGWSKEADTANTQVSETHWDLIYDKPSSFTPSSHTHTIGNVTGLQTALDGKQASGNYAAASHTHGIGDITDLQTSLDSKQASLGFTPYNATNPSGFITGYTETDTLNSVTGRGASTANNITLSGVGNLFNGHHYFSPHDENGNHYPHYNAGSSANGSKLNLRMFDNRGEVVLFHLNGNSKAIEWNGHSIWHAGNLTNLNQLTNGPGYITGISYDNVSGKPSTFTPSAHTHTIANVTGLQTALDGKQAVGEYAAASHTHSIRDITDLQTSLDGKQASLGFTPYNATNPSGFITSTSNISGNSATATNVAYSGLTGTVPTWNQNTTGNAASSTVAYDLQAADNTQIRFNSVVNNDYSTMTFFSRAWRDVQGANGLAYNFTTHNNAGGGGYGALQIYYGESGHVFAPTSFRAPQFRLTNSGNSAFLTGDEGWGARIQTDAGYILFGPANTSYAHIYTDRGQFYFNKDILINNVQVVVNSGTWAISTTGNAATSSTFSTGQTNYKGVTDNSVAGQLMWKNYGNNHTIFDASNSTSPSGGAVNNANSAIAWTGTYPTLMGWNGNQTYGVRVDSSRVADSAGAVAWDNVSGKPATFSPSAHTHGIRDITDLQTSLDGKQASLGFTPYNATNPSGFITGISYDNVSGKPSTFTPSAHTHAIRDITDLQTSLDGKLSTSGKAADSETVDGVDSSRIIFGDGARGSTGTGNMNDPNQKSGFHFQYNPTGAPYTEWWNWITVAGNSWQSSNNYQFQLAHDFHSDNFQVRRMTNGSVASWRTIIDSGNIGGQSVNFASSAGAVAWDNVSSKPTTFAPSAHTHTIANVTGLQTALDGKQASGNYSVSGHTHAIRDITDLQTSLDSKQASLGFTPYNATNPSGFITSTSNISGNSATTSQTVFSDLKINFPAGGGGGHGFSSNHYSMGLDSGNGGWSHPHYKDLIIGYHTGIRIGAHYSGVRFYNDSPTTDANNDGNGDRGENLLMTVGGYVGTANHTDVVVSNNLIANSSLRAPIFYDSNDTGFYADFNSTGTSINIAGSLRHANHNKPAILSVASGTSSAGASFAIQQETGEGWTGIFVDYEPYTGWGLYHDNPNNYFCFTAESATGQIRSFTVPSRASGNRTAYEKLRIDQNNGNIIIGGTGTAQSDFRAPIFYDSQDTNYFLNPNSNSYLSTLRVADASSGVALHVGNGSTYGVYTLDNARKYLVVSGEFYPHMALVATGANNANHGAVFSFVGSESGRARQWNLGTSNNNPFLFSIGYNATGDDNPHYGVGDGWSENDSFHARLIIDRSGNTKIRGMLYVNGTSGGMTTGNAVIHAGNIGSQSVNYATSAGNADTVDGKHATNNASNLAVYESNGYLYIPSWMNVNGGGIFSSTNNAHIRPNTGAYGAWEMIGSKNAWSGIWFNDSGDYLMANSDEVGHYQDRVGWKYRWYRGEMYISAGSTGGGTERTVLHSGNYSSYALPLSGGTVTGITNFQTNNGAKSGATDSAKLQAYSTGNNSAFMSFHKAGYFAVNFGLDDDNVMRLGGWSAAANRMQLDMSGNVTFAGNVTGYSDARIKTNVKTIDNALEKVKSLRGVSFTRTDSDDRSTNIGVIAQEVLQILPEVVSQDASGMYNVAYGNMAGLFIEAIKQQQSLIERQQKQIDELKALVDGLTK